MQGYYQRPDETDQVIRQGWLHTGDLGHLDEDNFLFVTGRKKELIVTNAGKNIAPVSLEALLTQDPLIMQAMVIGNQRNFLTALIVPDMAALQHKLNAEELSRDPTRSLQDPVVSELFEQVVQARLQDVSHHEQVRKFTLLAEPFSIERGELTAKLSLRRDQIAEQHDDVIAAMYERT